MKIKIYKPRLLEEDKQDKGQQSGAKDYETLLDQLSAIEKKYSTDYVTPSLQLPDSLNQNKISYAQPTVDQLLESARTNLAEKYLNKTQELNDKRTKTVNSIANAIDSKKLAAILSAAKLDSQKEEAKETANAESVKQGLARSSIAEGVRKEVEEGYNEEKDYATKQLNNDVAILTKQIAQAEEATQSTLQALSSARTADEQAEAARLGRIAQEKNDAVLKYNNSLEEKEQKYRKSVSEAVNDAENEEATRLYRILQLVKEVGLSGVSYTKYSEMLSLVKEFFDGMSQAEAAKLLNSDDRLRTYLGEYYNSIVDYIDKK